MRFSPVTGQWEQLPPLPEPRSSHDVAVLGEALYVGGGWRLEGGNSDGDNSEWHKTVLTLDLRDPRSG